MQNTSSHPQKRIRCAIYTRKSTEEGLEQEFNSLDAQRDAGEAYVMSQKHEGWMLVGSHYDDGGFSGGNMERPALQRLIEDVKAGLIDVVVYKIDRLSRSLTDFAQMVAVFDEYGTSFVSVTQNFNTKDSMGRLTLNILLSFAQFEREVIGERIRDKFAASKRKGMWMGGQPPLGYDIVERKLIVNPTEAEVVKHIFNRFTITRSITALVKELEKNKIRTKSFISSKGVQRGGRVMDKSYLYRMLRNKLYLGKTVHKNKVYEGQHKAIISQVEWDKVHAILQENPTVRGNESRNSAPAMLSGLITCKCCGCSMTPTGTIRHGKQYRYYTPLTAIKRHYSACKVGPIPAGEIEELVVRHVRQLFKAPEIISKVWQNCESLNYDSDNQNFTEQDVFNALHRFDEIWDSIFPIEQQRLMRLLVKEIIINLDAVKVTLRLPNLSNIVRQIQFTQHKKEKSNADRHDA